MSFSNDVKNELSLLNEKSPRHCNIAEILGFIVTKANVTYRYHKFFMAFETDNYYTTRRLFSLIKDTFKIKCQIIIKKNIALNKKTYNIYLDEQEYLVKMLKSLSIVENVIEKESFKINPLIIKDSCCKRAYIRSMFFMLGSISDPNKSYHLEFVFSKKANAEEFKKQLQFFDLNAKIIKRKIYYILYLKEADNIVDMLNIIGAYNSLLGLENIRVIKDVSNSVNRVVNCETANLSKTINASVAQIEDIEYILNKRGIDYLSEQLQSVALLRLDYPNATIKEIGEKLSPTISKSGVNHRLRKISEIAEELRRG